MQQRVEGGGLAGFLFGLIAGTVAAISSWTITELGLPYALGIGVIVGAIGYFLGDRFWFWIGERLRWFV